ncbi:MAG: hypothetical protein KDE22_13895 [Rhodobacterales bacterium]|nr:hypothetical protein [Rhodobacterales bacterium]
MVSLEEPAESDTGTNAGAVTGAPQVDEDLLSDGVFRLSVYQAGQAVIAFMLGKKIQHVRMLPRPPVTETDKVFSSGNWRSFCHVLEDRILELFGGRLAEEAVCVGSVCCSGDVSRIDELTRILAAIGGQEDPEDLYFQLEERAHGLFDKPGVRTALLTLGKELYDREQNGEIQVDGETIESIIRRFVEPPPRPSGMRSLLEKLGVA